MNLIWICTPVNGRGVCILWTTWEMGGGTDAQMVSGLGPMLPSDPDPSPKIHRINGTCRSVHVRLWRICNLNMVQARYGASECLPGVCGGRIAGSGWERDNSVPPYRRRLVLHGVHGDINKGPLRPLYLICHRASSAGWRLTKLLTEGLRFWWDMATQGVTKSESVGRHSLKH